MGGNIMTLRIGLLLGTGLALAAAAPVFAAESCKPGTTHKIAFMLKQQTAFRYLHADIPFFKPKPLGGARDDTEAVPHPARRTASKEKCFIAFLSFAPV